MPTLIRVLPVSITLAGTGGGPCLLMEPNSVSSRPLGLTLQGEQVDGPSGAGFLDKDGAKPATRYEFEFTCKTRETLRTLRDFFDARQGMATPFWFPAWSDDVEVAPYHDGVSVAAWIVGRGYAGSIFPLGAQYRRFLFVYGNQYESYRVTAVTTNTPTAGTDKLSMTATESSFGGTGVIAQTKPFTRAKGVTMYPLRWGRFDSDAFVPTRTTGGGGIVRLPIIELPDEATEPA